MTHDQFLAALEAEYAKCVAISRRKNADYGADADPFRNFRASEHLGVPPDKAILVRMSDKMSRASNLLDKPPQVEDESLEDTLRDLANYSIILLLLTRDLKRERMVTLPPIKWEDPADTRRFDVI